MPRDPVVLRYRLPGVLRAKSYPFVFFAGAGGVNFTGSGAFSTRLYFASAVLRVAAFANSRVHVGDGLRHLRLRVVVGLHRLLGRPHAAHQAVLGLAEPHHAGLSAAPHRRARHRRPPPPPPTKPAGAANFGTRAASFLVQRLELGLHVRGHVALAGHLLRQLRHRAC